MTGGLGNSVLANLHLRSGIRQESLKVGEQVLQLRPGLFKAMAGNRTVAALPVTKALDLVLLVIVVLGLADGAMLEKQLDTNRRIGPFVLGRRPERGRQKTDFIFQQRQVVAFSDQVFPRLLNEAFTVNHILSTQHQLQIRRRKDTLLCPVLSALRSEER